MSENFEKLKKRAVIASLLKSFTVGVSAGLLAVGIVLLALKLGSVDINAWYYVLIAVGTAIIGGGAFLAMIFPTERKFAKTLDKSFSLDERIQTMVAFKNDGGAVAELQRADADSCLAALPAKKPTFFRIYRYAVCIALMLAVFVPAVAVSASGLADSSGGNKGDSGFVYTDYMSAAVEGLIADAETSSCGEAVKASVVNELRNLDVGLGAVSSYGQMEKTVISTVTEINGVMYSDTSYSEICGTLSDEAKTYSLAIRTGIVAYVKSGLRFTSFEQVKAFEKTAERAVASDISPILDVESEALGKAFAEDGEQFVGQIREQISAIRSSLGECGVDTRDGLYKSLLAFSGNLAQIRKTAESGTATDEGLKNSLKEVFSVLSDDMSAALAKQSYSCAMELYIRQRLVNVFNVMSALPDFNDPEIPVDGSPNQSSGDDDEEKLGGGYGKGDMKYGSGDYIYNPDFYDEENDAYGGYVKYGEALGEKYYNEFLALVESGNYSEETVKALRVYFDILYSGIKDDTVN